MERARARSRAREGMQARTRATGRAKTRARGAHGRGQRDGRRRDQSGGLQGESSGRAIQVDPVDVGPHHQSDMPSTSTPAGGALLVTSSTDDVYRHAPPEQTCAHHSLHDMVRPDVVNPDMRNTDVCFAVLQPSVGPSQDDSECSLPYLTTG